MFDRWAQTIRVAAAPQNPTLSQRTEPPRARSTAATENGEAAAAAIDAAETRRHLHRTPAKIRPHPTHAHGETARSVPAPVATPFPPRKPLKTGQM